METIIQGPVIITRYLGPTNTRGSRVVATHKRDSETTWRKTISWDHALNAEANHQAAAEALLADWPYETRLQIVGRGHDADAYFWFCSVTDWSSWQLLAPLRTAGNSLMFAPATET